MNWQGDEATRQAYLDALGIDSWRLRGDEPDVEVVEHAPVAAAEEGASVPAAATAVAPVPMAAVARNLRRSMFFPSVVGWAVFMPLCGGRLRIGPGEKSARIAM